MYFGTIKAMSVHRRSCSDDNDAKSEEASDAEEGVASERVRHLRMGAIRQREALCVMQMQEMEWMSLDDIEYGDLEGILVVNDHEVGTPLFNTSTENLVIVKKIVRQRVETLTDNTFYFCH